jgi:EAL domain-containing protein (putative c-di-GMP-specific phosphodiesterase class I)/CheY-like chemotaxis protein
MSGAAEFPPEMATLRYLVVEDQGFQRWAVGQLLERMGAANVFFADDGTTALELYRTLDPPVDVIVTDLNMPQMDGMEFIRHVGESGRTVSLILTSDLNAALIASVAAMAKAYGLSLIGTIQKPVTAAKLAAALGRYTPPRSVVPAARREAFEYDEISIGIANGQFVPYFQPKIDLANGVLRGVEVLARWHHPVHGLLPPSAFMGPLESTGRVERLTMALLAGACQACREWLAEGIPGAGVALNVSVGSLSDVSLADRLAQAVGASGLEPQHVTIEVTETAAVSDVGRVLENLSRLRMKGFGLSIDDYGTGYSSLQQLSRIPFTELKIDQSFVRNAPTNAGARAVLESSLEIAAKLGITAVAEGVETGRELELLVQLSCPVAQGYLLCKPLPAAEFRDWLRRNDATAR